MEKREPAQRRDWLNAEEKLIVYWETIEYIVGLNRSSEIKAGLIISFYGLLLGVILQMITTLETSFRLSFFLIVVLVVFVFFVCRSIYFSFRCFLPQIETKFDKNMFFFHDVITHYGDIHSFSKNFSKLLENEEELNHQLGQQIYVNSLIASKKFSDVNNSVRNLVYSFVPMLIGIITVVISLFS
ncbi:Pycsar system effector family protein [Robiginitalea marina]|uniref:DUF5706 domain-containing protein n=1 Tax=Robiginitalea marina TaxID=2954105 RepID=A0ABT1AYR8_9FLAO|nr:Pycsar system effector family protein [Robiginitalea marina]MCO5725151.1 DUF5706 domain-containing protein [Robiginitalea marina]